MGKSQKQSVQLRLLGFGLAKISGIFVLRSARAGCRTTIQATQKYNNLVLVAKCCAAVRDHFSRKFDMAIRWKSLGLPGSRASYPESDQRAPSAPSLQRVSELMSV
jgi:hypothetical protein